MLFEKLTAEGTHKVYFFRDITIWSSGWLATKGCPFKLIHLQSSKRLLVFNDIFIGFMNDLR